MEILSEQLNIMVAVLGIIVWAVTVAVAWMKLKSSVALIDQKLAGNITSNTESLNEFRETFEKSHQDTREWLKSLQTLASEHDGDIKVLKDRIKR